MCGIFAWARLDGGRIDPSRAEAALESLQHRGPDASGDVTLDTPAGQCFLGHRRLSVIDLSDAANQPMQGEQGAWLSYNGEIYNFPALATSFDRAELRTHSDTEVLLRCLDRDGLFKTAADLNGMFAFVRVSASGDLWAARDRRGIKPLYYIHRPGKELLIASEPKALFPFSERSLDSRGVSQYLLYGSALGQHTLYQDIRELEPGCALSVERGRLAIRSYADPGRYAERPICVSFADALTQVRELFDAAIKRQLRSDVPVGIFLSSGVDSSAVLARAAQHRGDLVAYTARFDTGQVNEVPAARRTAKHFGVEHRALSIGADALLSAAEHDFPFGDAATLTVGRLCQAVDRKVVLMGDGGDECFGGYRRYALLKRRHLWGVLGDMLGQVPEGAARLARYSKRYRRGERIALAQSYPAWKAMAALLSEEPLEYSVFEGLTPRAAERFGLADAIDRYREVWPPDLPFADAMFRTDAQVILPDIFLPKVDRASMAHSIEVRVPLLDDDLVETVMRYPASVKLKGGQPKALLKEALKPWVPSWVLSAPKLGFSVPYKRWLRGTLRPTLLGALDVLAEREWFESDYLRRIEGEHFSGRQDHGFRLYKLMQLGRWLERHDQRGL